MECEALYQVDMALSNLRANGLWAAGLIVVCMLFWNYRLLRSSSPEIKGADTYTYESDKRSSKINSEQVLSKEPGVLAGPEGAAETIRLSFSAHLRADALPENSKVSVFLVKEVGAPPSTRVMLFVRQQDDGSTGVVSTLSKPGESGKTAALRALAVHAAVSPVPDIDFITFVGSASGGHAVFVAYIRQERLHLKGRQHAVGGDWVAFKDVALADSLKEATVGPCVGFFYAAFLFCFWRLFSLAPGSS